jgi:hypothetical protein
MSFGVTMLKPSMKNPATSPELTEDLVARVKEKREQVLVFIASCQQRV